MSDLKWQCQKCNAVNDPDDDRCWNCGRDRQ